MRSAGARTPAVRLHLVEQLEVFGVGGDDCRQRYLHSRRPKNSHSGTKKHFLSLTAHLSDSQSPLVSGQVCLREAIIVRILLGTAI